MKDIVWGVLDSSGTVVTICIYKEDAEMLANNYYEEIKAIPKEDIHEYM